jgi:DNA-binding response OmpR family regulator
MKTIALIEDDPDLHELLRYNLEREGFRLVGSETGHEALSFLLKSRPDLLVLDIMLPGTDGLEICKSIRSHPDLNELPIIFLTARAAETDRVIGLELGANDYLVKPFFVRELIARIKLQVRQKGGEHAVLAHGELELDRQRFEVRLAGSKIGLTATEFRLLEFLMGRPSRVFTREELLNHVWGHDRNVAERAVDVCVLRLRQKLGEDPSSPRWVHSVRGFGYTFDPGRMMN